MPRCTSCSASRAAEPALAKVRSLGTDHARGRAVRRFELSSARLRAEVVDVGARLAVLEYTTDAGESVPMILALPDAQSVLDDRGATGAVCGRFANRIRGGRFVLDGTIHELERNDGTSTLHGGPRGFMTRAWAIAGHEVDGPGLDGPGLDGPRLDGPGLEDPRVDGPEAAVRFQLQSPNGDQGFPGTLDASVKYSVQHDAITLSYLARTDAPTVLNLTNHAYFTLGCENVRQALVEIRADTFLLADAEQLPTGAVVPVDGSPFDLRRSATVGSILDSGHDQVRIAGGVDQCFVLNEGAGARVRMRAPSGIAMEVTTTEPAVQVYTANHLQPVGRAICFETQHFPDSPNQPDFPSTSLRPGEEFRSTTTYRFAG